MKLFLATPISTFSDPEEYNVYRKTVVQFVSALRKEHTVSCDIDGLETQTQYISPNSFSPSLPNRSGRLLLRLYAIMKRNFPLCSLVFPLVPLKILNF
jgi:hypothetical protein